MIEYIVGGAVLLAFVANQSSTPERRRRWLARMNGSSPSAIDAGDPTPPLDLDVDAGTHHQQHHDHGTDYGGHHGGDHGGGFDMGGHH